MKNQFKRLVVIGLGLSMSLLTVAPAQAAFNDIRFNADVTVTVNGLNLTIASGSNVEAYTVGSTNLNFTLASGSAVTVRSTGFATLTSSPNKTINCTSTFSFVSFNFSDGASVSISPTVTNACSTSTGGGGGGGGSSPPAPAPSPSPTPTPSPAPTPTPTPNPGLPSPSPAVTAAPGGAHSNGTLVLDGKTVYLVKDGKRVGFRNEAEYKSHGYSFGQAVAANARDKALPQAEFVQKALEGTLVIDAKDNKTVYMIGSNGTKRGFASEAAFKGLGYKFGALAKLDLTDYPPGAAIGIATEVHPDGALVLDGKTIWWVRGNARQGFESEAVFNTYGFSFAKVVPANAADKALAQGSLVKFRDGTLVKDGASYYLISDGKKLKFSSATDLAAKGYKTSNAISGNLSSYDSAGTVQ